MNQTHKLLFAGLAFGLLASICLWLFWGNRGILLTNAEPQSYLLSISGFGRLACPQSNCRLAVPQGRREICLEAEGYEPVCETLLIPWRREVTWQPLLRRLPHLVPANSLPLSTPSPTPASLRQEFFGFDAEMRLIKSGSGKTEVITAFEDLADPQIKPWNGHLLVIGGGEAYLVDPIRKSKKRVFRGTSPRLHLVSGQVALIQDADLLWVLTDESERFIRLPFATTVERVMACDGIRLTVATKAPTGEMVFVMFDPATGATQEIAKAFLTDEQGLALSCVPDDPRAIRLDFAAGEAKVLKF